jgi:hypothetical protein
VYYWQPQGTKIHLIFFTKCQLWTYGNKYSVRSRSTISMMEIGLLLKCSQNPSNIKYHTAVEPSLRIYIYIKYILILSSHCRFRNTKFLIRSGYPWLKFCEPVWNYFFFHCNNEKTPPFCHQYLFSICVWLWIICLTIGRNG